MSSPSDLELGSDVLFGIAQLALDGVEGVTPVSPPARVGEFLTGRRAKGIRVERDGDEVVIELNVTVTYGLRIPDVVREAQAEVREAVASMTGLPVRAVAVTVVGVDVPDAHPGAEGVDG